MSRELIKFFDSYWKFLPPLALVFMAYMQTQFVSKNEFHTHTEKIFNRVEKIEQILIRMEASVETDKRHEAALTDHETRIRVLEKKQ
jgi:hypothetical protein